MGANKWVQMSGRVWDLRARRFVSVTVVSKPTRRLAAATGGSKRSGGEVREEVDMSASVEDRVGVLEWMCKIFE